MDGKNTFDAKLIQEMQRHPLLYDVKSPNYKDIPKKFKAWCDISKKVGKSVDTCKKRWKTLRYRFLTESVKMRTAGGNPVSVKWHLYKKLLFLEGHVNPRKSLPAVGNPGKSEEKDNYEDDYRLENYGAINYLTHVSAEPQVNIIETNYLDYDYIMNRQTIGQKRQCDSVPFNHMENSGKRAKLHRPVIDDGDVKEVPNLVGHRSDPKRRLSRRDRDEKFLGFLESMGKIIVNNCGDGIHHEPFLQLLTSKLNRLPVLEQEDIKMEVLNRVHQRVSEFERKQPSNELKKKTSLGV